MRHLILMRHAKTEPWHEGIDDAGRALTERGQAEAVLVARSLTAAGLAPDTVLVSSARRTRETWAQMKADLPGARMDIRDELYLADADEIMEIVLASPETGCLMVIGHNPGIHEAAAELVRMGGADDAAAGQFVLGRFPTGAAAVFRRDGEAPGKEGALRLSGVFWGRELAEQTDPS
jgi:phosphohistidine phosphatase